MSSMFLRYQVWAQNNNNNNNNSIWVHLHKQKGLCMNEIIGCVIDVLAIHHSSLPCSVENQYVTPRRQLN